MPVSQCVEPSTTIINGQVYCGGGGPFVEDESYLYNVYRYDPSQDSWTTLLPLPVRFFGLGQVSGELVAVGGKRSNERRVSQVSLYNKLLNTWNDSIPPMPTPRDCPSVLSLQTALLVAGGVRPSLSYTGAVELFKPDIWQWYTSDPLPTPCRNMSLSLSFGSTLYALGGYWHPSFQNQALYASVDDLVRNAAPADRKRINQHGRSSAW